MAGDDLILHALGQSLQKDPGNAVLWAHYADLLAKADRPRAAIEAIRKTLALDADQPAAQRLLIGLLRQTGEAAEALIRAEALLESGDDAAVRMELARILCDRGELAAAASHYARAVGADPSLADEALARSLPQNVVGIRPDPDPTQRTVPPQAAESESEEDNDDDSDDGDDRLRLAMNEDNAQPEDLAAEFDAGDLYVTFQDVAGLEDVKKQIHLRIIAPFKNKQIYQAFNRRGGGGILLYGPPGCGKTFIARATAGECEARFIAVGIHTVVDKYFGESERLIHALFEDARRRTPTVLFFDEFDALGASRSRSDSQFWRTLADQLLQEMDGLAGQNTDVLVFAATNLPWNVDAAFRRPGRFDRSLFVPPPDRQARAEILRMHSARLPGAERIQVEGLAQKTTLFTGADLKALCERAAEDALSKSLETGAVHPVQMADFERARERMTSSAEEWLATARNYARYANDAGQFDELADFLKKAKRW